VKLVIYQGLIALKELDFCKRLGCGGERRGCDGPGDWVGGRRVNA
jgi:hypothetical protein